MMNESLVTLFAVSLSGSCLFVFIQLIDKIFNSYEVYWQEIVMKILLFYFLLPAIVIPILFFRHRQPEIEYVNGEDITMWITPVEGMENIIEKRWNYLSVILFGIWIIGFCIIFIRRVVRDTRIIKKLEILATIEKDTKINQIKDNIRKELKIQKNIDIYKSRLVDSPCLCGLLKPKIFFPESFFSKEEIEFLLRHELYHYKRRDILYNMLISLFWGVHWFNPITWVFTNYLYNFCEISCDQDVLKKYDKREREQYAYLLLKLSEGMNGRKVYGLTSFKSQNQNFMNRRLYNIMKQKKYGKKLVGIGIICSLIICPIVTYASTIGVTMGYNYLLENVPYDESRGFFKIKEKEMPDNIPKQKIIRTEGTYFTINPKETNAIDFKIAGNGKKETSAYIKKGAKIIISLIGDETDKFKVIISHNSEEKKVVNSSNGIVGINNFQADASGTYKIKIKNIMPSKIIHVRGSISVES